MSYTPTTWVDGETPVNATNLNKIENGIKVNAEEVQEILQDVYELSNKVDSGADLVITGIPHTGTGDYFNWINGSYTHGLYGTQFVTFDPEKVVYSYEKLTRGEEVRAVLKLPNIALNSWNGAFSAVFSAIRVAAAYEEDPPFLIVRFDCVNIFWTGADTYSMLEYMFTIDTVNRTATLVECHQRNR